MDRVLEPEYMDTSEEADAYDTMVHDQPNDDFVARLLELGVGERVIDLGCGPGQIPLLVCERVAGARVVGFDAAGTMLAHARRHIDETEHGQRIELVQGDAKALCFPDRVFDTVYSNTILHHIPDPKPFLSEARRVLRPGGTILIRDLYRPEGPERRDELVDLYAGDASEYQRSLFRASLHAAFTPDELRELADGAGLGAAELVIDTDRHMSLQIPAA